MLRTPSYAGLHPSSLRASIAARGSSRKTNTTPEQLLRAALWKEGLRYRTNKRDLPGVPDIVFVRHRLVVFVDGDFWHGKSWNKRKIMLRRGHNSDYWLAKIKGNMRRDFDRNRKLRAAGWTVLRIWESEIRRNINKVVNRIESIVGARAGLT
jgi:DNA mismatch endonuclease, patch repair protein